MKHLNIFKQLLIAATLLIAFTTKVNAQLSGNYVVGPTGTYLTLADAVSDLLTQGVNGPTTFLIQSGTYSGGSWQAAISSISGADATNRVTFTSQSGSVSDVILQYSATSAASNYIFLLNTSFVTIKNLTLQAQGTTYGSAIQVAGASSNDSITGCVISATSTTATGVDRAVVAMGGAAPLSGTTDVLFNNTITGGSVGIWLAGASSATTNNHVIQANTITNPSYYGIYASYANNLKIRNNIINQNTTVNNSAALYLTNNGGGLDVLNNTITVTTTTSYHYGMYNINMNPGSSPVDANYLNNTVTVTVSTGSSQALYNQFCTRLKMMNNNFRSVATSSGGTAYPPTLTYNCSNSVAEGNIFSAIGLASGATVANGTYYFMSFASNCSIRFNTFNDSTTTGAIFGNGYYLFNNTANSQCNRNTFNIASTTGSIFAATGTYQWLCAANNSNVDSNRWNITSTTGQIGTTGSATNMGFSNSVPSGSTISFSNNRMDITTNTTATSYGLWGYYPAYSMSAGSTAIVANDTFNIAFNAANTFYFWGYYGQYSTISGVGAPVWKMNNNIWNYTAPNGVGTLIPMSYYYPMGYMGAGAEFKKNKININTTSGTIYNLGYYYFGYQSYNTVCDSNDFNITSTSATVYGFNYYYLGGYSTDVSFSNNNLTINGTTGQAYSFMYYPAYYSYSGFKAINNKCILNMTSGQIYNPYFLQAYGNGARFTNNTFTSNCSSSGSIYSPYYLNYYGSADTCNANTFTATTNGGSIYAYNYGISNLNMNNVWTLNNTSGGIYYYTAYYPNGGIFKNNTIKATTTSGPIYGLYDYSPSSSYPGNLILNNKFDLRSTSGGTVYGFAVSSPYASKSTYMGNLVTTQTTGYSYLFQFPSGGYHYSGGDLLFVNNTFHSNANSPYNYLIDCRGGNSSYPYKTRLYNNIFSSSYPVTGTAIMFGDTARFHSDYNLAYVPGGAVSISSTTPSLTATSLQQWRTATKRDLNSLIYDPGYMDAPNFDFRPNPSNSNSWSVNGRGMHFPGDTLDINLNVRAKALKDGVPDLGAYEFTPASTPPDAVATPATPAINTRQVFTFGGDTVCAVDWGLSVPSSASVKQYTGTKATFNPPLLPNTERMFAYANLNTPAGVYDYNAKFYYKDPWRGDIPSETLSKFAKSVNGATWEGFNYGNGITDSVLNILNKKDNLDSLPIAMTGVRNARIGIRCLVAPTGLTHANVVADQADEYWDAEFNASYQIFADFSKLTPTSVPGSAVIVTTNSHHFSGLTEDKTYYVHLRTICGPKDTTGWSLDSFHTMITCHAPNLQLTSMSATRAVVYWDTVKTASSYEYVLDQSPNDPAFGTYTLSRSILCDFLKTGTAYYFHARTRCYTIYNISPWATLQFTPVGIDQLPGSGKGIAAYPNPVKDMVIINVAGKLGADAVITISDVTGKAVRSINVISNKTEVDMANLPAGMYVIKYSDKERIEVTKVNKE